MSRSNYNEEPYGTWDMIRWRGAVASATKGTRGQTLLKELLAALDSMPEKRLIKESLDCADGVCALGALGRARGLSMVNLDPEEPATVAEAFGVAPALAQEIAFYNDECCPQQTPEERWVRMREWVVKQLPA